MSFLKTFLATAPAVATASETVYAKLLSIRPTRPANVNGETKARYLAQLSIDDKVIEKATFGDGILGLPTFVPADGVECQATFRPNVWVDKDGVEYQDVNLVALAIKGE